MKDTIKVGKLLETIRDAIIKYEDPYGTNSSEYLSLKSLIRTSILYYNSDEGLLIFYHDGDVYKHYYTKGITAKNENDSDYLLRKNKKLKAVSVRGIIEILVRACEDCDFDHELIDDAELILIDLDKNSRSIEFKYYEVGELGYNLDSNMTY